MLKLLFDWFDAHPQSYWLMAGFPTLFLLGWTYVNGRTTADAGAVSARHDRRDVGFVLILLVVLFAWRWPFLLSADEFNPDESQFIAGAITLRGDPLPWRGVDGTTSGPLNFYPLLLPALLGLPLDYFTARLVALFLVWAALASGYFLFRARYGSAVAGLATLPTLAFFATVTDPDFVHYSSEHLSIFLLGVSAACLLWPRKNGFTIDRWELVGCSIAGLLPWAKLQSGPMAAALVAIALISAATSRSDSRAARLRAIGKRLLAAAGPSCLFLGIIAATGQFEHFAQSYLLQNFAYLDEGASSPLPELWQASKATGHFPLYLVLSLAGAGLGVRVALRNPEQRIPLLFCGVLLPASLLCILAPHRAFLHYLLLLTVPLLLCFGVGLGGWWQHASPQARRGMSGVVLLAAGLGPFAFRAAQPVPAMFGNFLNHWTEPRSILANAISRYAPRGSRLAIWGWAPGLFVQTGLAQGTRDGNTYWAIMPSARRDYFRERFLADFLRHQPELFVDAVGEDAYFFSDRARSGHENFPELTAHINQHYDLILELGYSRLYAKRGLRPSPAYIDSPSYPQSPTEHSHVIGALPVESLSPSDLPQWRMRTGFVQMMHPPAEVAWSLDGTTREILVEYGIAPEAYRHARSDGVELIFELHSPDAPVRHLFHRFLDPVKQPSDRGAQSLHLTLPPYRSGDRLIARTTRGPSGDGAWDWIYLARIAPIRSPGFTPAQFPHFNRVPDAADAELSYLIQEAADTSLVLHAPAALVYQLHGDERRVSFEYGFRSGAYSDGGQTDGAIFRVELHPSDTSVQILFEQKLDPVANDGDRGTHSVALPLSPKGPGAKLVVKIDPGKGNAWDWTYLTQFVLE